MKKHWKKSMAIFLVCCLGITLMTFANTGTSYSKAYTCNITNLAVHTNGTQWNGHTEKPSMDATGRYIAFQSAATNIIADDTNDVSDVFVKNTENGSVECISRIFVDEEYQMGNAESRHADISDDGRYVVFESKASNLVTGVTGEFFDVFLYDRDTKSITCITTKGNGDSGNENGNGGNGDSGKPAISGDGSRIVFRSKATNLIAGMPPTGTFEQVFLYDVATGTTTAVSARYTQNGIIWGNAFSMGPDISSNGAYVVFTSLADNLIEGENNTSGFAQIYLYNINTQGFEVVSKTPSGVYGGSDSYSPSINDDGTRVAFKTRAGNLRPEPETNDGNLYALVCIMGTQTRQFKEIAMVREDGEPGDGLGTQEDNVLQISGNGQRVALSCQESWMASGIDSDSDGVYSNIWVYSVDGEDEWCITKGYTDSGTTTNPEGGNGRSIWPAISQNGEFVIFQSKATDLLPIGQDQNGYDDIFLGSPNLASQLKDNMIEAYSHMQSVEVDGQIYIFGGSNYYGKIENNAFVKGHGIVGSIFKFNPLAANGSQWSKLPNKMGTARTSFAASVLEKNSKKYIYVSGGLDNSGDVLSSVERFDISAQQWEPVTETIVERSGHGMVAYNGELYVVGGINLNGYVDSMQRYDSTDEAWVNTTSTEAAFSPMPTPCTNFGIEIVNGKIYVIGGEKGDGEYLDSIQIYDIAQNQWTVQQGILSKPKSNMGTAVKGTEIYISCGWNGMYLKDVEKYDTVTGQAQTTGWAKTTRQGVASEIVGGNIYILGGENFGLSDGSVCVNWTEQILLVEEDVRL